MALVLVLLDAFRSDYVNAEDTPFLWSCAQEGEYYKRVQPGYGFCERTEILTGLSPIESGNVLAIGHDPANSPFRHARGLRQLAAAERTLSALSAVFGSFFRERVIAWFRWRLDCKLRTSGSRMSTYRIPIHLLPKWRLTEDQRDHREAGAFSVPSLLDRLTACGRRYSYDGFTALGMEPNGSDHDRLLLGSRSAVNPDIDFVLLYQSRADAMGHAHGPRSTELKAIAAEMDQDLERFTHGVLRDRPETTFVFLGDHGMLDVIARFDVFSKVKTLAKECRIAIHADMLVFLDSTIARFWFNADRGHSRLQERLLSSPDMLRHGSFKSTHSSCTDAPNANRLYGDLLWRADPGVLVFPDFFHSILPCRGMHGYDPLHPDSHGMCIVHGSAAVHKQAEHILLTEVHGILERTLELS